MSSASSTAIEAGGVRIGDLDVALARAADDGAAAVHLVRPVADRDPRLRLLDAELDRRGGLRRHRRDLLAVDHRVPGLARGRAFGALLRLDHPRRDPELAHGEVAVRLHHDARLGEEGVALATCVLGEVLAQLVDERVLVRGELLPVGGREVDRVLVRDVDLRDRDRPVVVHLLRQLAGQLDRLDVRTEGAPEGTLDEAFDPLLDRPEKGHA